MTDNQPDSKGNAEISNLEIKWEHNTTYNDWILNIPLPRGHIRGAVAFTDANPKNLTVWGTVEVKAADRLTANSQRYDHPSIGIDAVSRNMMKVMANIITDLVTSTNDKNPPPH